jgi:hypothetical protein
MRLRIALALLLLPAIAHGQAFRLGQGAQMACRSAAPTAASSRGIVWCKSTDSDALYYTTPAGVSAAVGAGGGGGTTQTIDVISATAATGKTLTAAVADSGTNVGFILNNSTTLSGTTLLLSLRNNGTEKFSVADDGSAIAGGFPVIAAPTFSGCTAGTNAGTGGGLSCTVTRTGPGNARVQLTTGASGAGIGDLFYLTPTTNFASVPVCIAQSDSGTAQNSGGYGLAYNSTTSSVSALHIESGATITNGTTYYINVICGP